MVLPSLALPALRPCRCDLMGFWGLWEVGQKGREKDIALREDEVEGAVLTPQTRATGSSCQASAPPWGGRR